ncbi:MAG: glycosyltransferase family 1 protein, partial [Verrucomicrobiota bacterium]|nr:glycosyltransferase family 1 protein [Verrucomicrobiota bacterium]
IKEIKMLKILCSVMGYDGGKSGISEYINSTLKELSKKNSVSLIISKSDAEIFPVPEGKNLKYIIYPNWLKKPILNMFWHLFILPFTIGMKKYDFVFLPAGNRRLFCYYNIPSIVTFHDLSQFHIEGKYDAFRMFYIKKIIPFFLKKADMIMSISESTKKDMLEFYNFPENKIMVNYESFDFETYNMNVSAGKDKVIAAGLEKKYLLYIARIEHPGKNHLNLIKAYEQLPDKMKEQYDLALAGSMWSGGEKIKAYAEQSHDCDKIKFLGFVKKDLLPFLYKNASLYVFPSYYEGFGIPLLEAMNTGIPVVCSNTSSLPEIGGDATLTFNPAKPSEIKERIVEVLSDKNLYKKMKEKGLKNAAKFTWKKHITKIIGAYEQEINRNK